MKCLGVELGFSCDRRRQTSVSSPFLKHFSSAALMKLAQTLPNSCLFPFIAFLLTSSLPCTSPSFSGLLFQPKPTFPTVPTQSQTRLLFEFPFIIRYNGREISRASASVSYNSCQGETGGLLLVVSPSVCLDQVQGCIFMRWTNVRISSDEAFVLVFLFFPLKFFVKV